MMPLQNDALAKNKTKKQVKTATQAHA